MTTGRRSHNENRAGDGTHEIQLVVFGTGGRDSNRGHKHVRDESLSTGARRFSQGGWLPTKNYNAGWLTSQ